MNYNNNIDYEIVTDLEPEELTTIGKIIFNKWLAFALGQTTIGGKTLIEPTGEYAASIKMANIAPNMIRISSNSQESSVIEMGHKPVDMLQYLQPGKTYPIHVSSSGKNPSLNPKIWAKRRTFDGAAVTPLNAGQRKALNTSGTGQGWMIPAMVAYSPAHILATDTYNQLYNNNNQWFRT